MFSEAHYVGFAFLRYALNRALTKLRHHAEFRAEFENLALAYLRLAEQAKQKDYLDINSETPLLKQHKDPQPKHKVLSRTPS